MKLDDCMADFKDPSRPIFSAEDLLKSVKLMDTIDVFIGQDGKQIDRPGGNTILMGDIGEVGELTIFVEKGRFVNVGMAMEAK